MVGNVRIMLTTELFSKLINEEEFLHAHSIFCKQTNSKLGINEIGRNGSHGCYFTNGDTSYDLSKNAKLREVYKLAKKRKGSQNPVYVVYKNENLVFDICFLDG
jgi:hypothetical protein